MNKRELAEKLGVSETSITNWQYAGMPVLENGRRGKCGVYDLAAVVRWIKVTGAGEFCRTGPRVNVAALEREIGLDQSAPALSAPPPRFPDPQTIRAIEEAMAASLVRSGAILVRLLELAPSAALKAWEVVTGEIASAFDDAQGFDTGPNNVTGDSRVLLEDGGRELLIARIGELTLTLPHTDVDVHV